MPFLCFTFSEKALWRAKAVACGSLLNSFALLYLAGQSSLSQSSSKMAALQVGSSLQPSLLSSLESSLTLLLALELELLIFLIKNKH